MLRHRRRPPLPPPPLVLLLLGLERGLVSGATEVWRLGQRRLRQQWQDRGVLLSRQVLGNITERCCRNSYRSSNNSFTRRLRRIGCKAEEGAVTPAPAPEAKHNEEVSDQQALRPRRGVQAGVTQGKLLLHNIKPGGGWWEWSGPMGEETALADAYGQPRKASRSESVEATRACYRLHWPRDQHLWSEAQVAAATEVLELAMDTGTMIPRRPVGSQLLWRAVSPVGFLAARSVDSCWGISRRELDSNLCKEVQIGEGRASLRT